MNTIYYFNIDFSCNNRCVFCISHNTGLGLRNIEFDEFVKTLRFVAPDETDKVIINGGEPSLHPDFYRMLDFIEKQFCTNTVVYTNGTLLNVDGLGTLKRTIFVIPIHGDKEVHNGITRNVDSYDQTIRQMYNLQYNKIRYAIKFILNKQLVESRFNIHSFLRANELRPEKIFLARLIETKKALKNQVQYPLMFDLQVFLRENHECLKKNFELVYLDIPLCFLVNDTEKLRLPVAPSFFYTDYRRKMVKKDYYKEVKILGSLCDGCRRNVICSLMQNSYLTLAFRKDWQLVVE